MTAYPDKDRFLEYCDKRNIVLPSFEDDDAIEAVLLVASETFDRMFSGQFSGVKTAGRNQERAWPRTGAKDRDGYEFSDDELPREVLQATYELGAIEANSPGSLTVDFTPSKYKSASVDGAVSVTWSSDVTTAEDAQPQFFKVEQIVAPLLTAENAGYSLLSGKSVRA